jgi:indole-3-acetate monooxygenase
MAGLVGTREERVAALAEVSAAVDGTVDEMESRAQLPDDVVACLRRTGAFRMAMPAAWGGPELPMVEIVDVIEELSYIEGAVGWYSMIGCDGGFYSAWLDDEVGRGMYSNLDSITAGWVNPVGKVTPVDGGYRLSGRWSFGSAGPHADWFCSGGLVPDPFEWRMFFVPGDEVEILPGTWDTTGLRGSGSYDYAIDDAFVPAERTFTFAETPRRSGSLYRHRATFAVKVAAVPLGLARRAIDETRALAEKKVVMPQLVAMRELPAVQESLGRAEALVAAHRTWFLDVVGQLTAQLESGREPDADVRRHLLLSASAAIQASRDAVELLATVVGSDSVKRSQRLERIRRDIATASTHIVGRSFDACGRALLGLDPAHPLF